MAVTLALVSPSPSCRCAARCARCRREAPALRPHARRPRRLGPLLRPAADDGAAGPAHDPARVRRLDDRRHLGDDRLPADGVDRHAGARPPGRHVRQGAPAGDRPARARRRNADGRALELDRDADRRPRGPGRRRRDLPARLRDHPRRVPARARRRRDRPDLGHLRHRRRRRPRAGRPDRRPPRLHVDLLAQPGRDPRRRRRHALLRARVAGQDAGEDRLGRRRAAGRRARLRAARRVRGGQLGLGVGRGAGAARRRGRAARGVGALRAARRRSRWSTCG